MKKPKAIILKTEYIVYVEYRCSNPSCGFIMKEYRNIKDEKIIEVDCPKCDNEMVLEIAKPY